MDLFEALSFTRLNGLQGRGAPPAQVKTMETSAEGRHKISVNCSLINTVIVPTRVTQCGVSSPSVRHISKHDSYRLLGPRIVSKKGSKVFTVYSLQFTVSRLCVAAWCRCGDALIDLCHCSRGLSLTSPHPQLGWRREHGHMLALIRHIFTDQLSIN